MIASEKRQKPTELPLLALRLARKPLGTKTRRGGRRRPAGAKLPVSSDRPLQQSSIQYRCKSNHAVTFDVVTMPSDLERRVFELLGVNLVM